MNSPVKKCKVVAVVNNSVLHDARVLKQATSLSEAGYEVTVVGIMDARQVQAEQTLESGVKVRLAPWRSAHHRTIVNLLLWTYVIGMAILVPMYWLLFDVAWASLFASGVSASTAAAAKLFILLVGAGLSFWLFRRVYLPQRNFYRRYSALEFPSAPQSSFFETKIKNILDKKREEVLAELCLEEAPVILHCHDVHTIPIGEIVKERLGCKVVYDAHEIYEELAQGSPAAKAHNERLQYRAERLADAFVTINASIAEFYRDKYSSLPRAKIIKNATYYDAVPHYDGRLHRAAGLPVEQKILLYQGGFAKLRGLDNLVNTLPYLPEDWSIVLMGWGSHEASLKKLANEVIEAEVKKCVDIDLFSVSKPRYEGLLSKLRRDGDSAPEGGPSLEQLRKDMEDHMRAHYSKRLVFIDRVPQPELALWSCGASIGIIPYENVGLNHYYCTPNKLWEYPAAGVPILVSPFPEMSAVVEQHKVGWQLDDPLDDRKLGEFLAKLSVDELAEKANNCHAYMAGDNWDKYGAELISLYASLD